MRRDYRMGHSFALNHPPIIMSEHHPDPVESNIETHPVKLAIAIGVGAIALVVLLVMLAYFAVGQWGVRSVASRDGMSPEQISARIKPVSTVVIDESKKVEQAAPAAATPSVAAAAVPAVAIPAADTTAKNDAKGTYDTACAMCHAAGVAGAPKLGDKGLWAARIATGKDALYASALKGKGAMPAKGGNAGLTDDAVKAAVDFMIAQSK